jgi:hypothetical protein
MFLVGARFDLLAAAQAALEELRRAVQVEPGSLGLRPLGSLRYEAPAEGLVVAGRFRSGDVDRVTEILERHGGEIVFKRAEWRPPRPLSRSSERASARCPSFTRLRRSPH